MKDSMNLSQEDHDSTSRQETQLPVRWRAHFVQFACVVVVRVIVDGVLGVMIVVLIGLDEVLVIYVINVAIFVVIFCIWRCTLYTTRRWQWTALAVTDFITVNCASNSFVRFMPQIKRWFTDLHRFPRSISVQVHLCGEVSNEGCHQDSLPLPPWGGGALRPIFIVRLVLRFLEAMQSRQCFLEVRLTPCRHRIEIHQIRTDPPIATIYINFFLCGNMTVVFACKSIHFKDDFFRATQLDHRLSEPLVTDKSIVNVFVVFLSTPPLKLFCSVEFFASPSFFPYLWPCGRPFLM